VAALTRDSARPIWEKPPSRPLRTIGIFPSEVVLGGDDQMTKECAINLDHVQTVAKAKLGPVITTLGQERLREIRKALLFALGFCLAARNL